MLIFTVGMTYCVVAPVITPFLLFYFGFGYLTLRYMLYYVYRPSPDSGGLLWPLMFNRLMVGMLVSQLTVAGVLSVKEATIAVRGWRRVAVPRVSSHTQTAG